MNKVLFRAEEVPMPSWTKKAEAYIQKVLETIGHKDWEVSVLLCGNRYIKTLNASYRDKDEPTDVLSFNLGETDANTGRYLAGDIVLSLDALEENARFFDVTVDEEMRRLFVHGILHLSGEDHATNRPEEPMLKRQEEIIARLAGECIQENGT